MRCGADSAVSLLYGSRRNDQARRGDPRGERRRGRLVGLRPGGLETIAALVDPTLSSPALLGQKNKEVSDELSLSLRSLERTLTRTYATLGVSSKAQMLALVRGDRTATRAPAETGSGPGGGHGSSLGLPELGVVNRGLRSLSRRAGPSPWCKGRRPQPSRG